MKKIYVIILLLIIHGKIYSLDFIFANGFLNHYNSIIIDDKNTSYYFMANLINFEIVNIDSKVGLFVSPVQYSFISHPQIQLLSFINMKMYYNFMDVYRSSILGPFFSINWINLKNFNEFDINNIVYSAGLLWSERFYFDLVPIIASNYFTLETGYKNINGKHHFYAGVQISDPVGVFAMILDFFSRIFI